MNINELIAEVKQEAYYVPRDYQTLGGGWTVDSYKRGEVTVQVMDEGYTTVVTAPGLRVIKGYRGEDYIRYVEGDENLVQDIVFG